MVSDVPFGLPEQKSEERIKLENRLKELNKSLIVDDLITILGSTVKRDDENKAITLVSMLLTYTEEDQINIGFLAESSTGKSYIPLELSWYFPKEDVMKLGYASPTAFFHEHGELRSDPIDKRDVPDEKKRKILYVDLKQKIVIFLDQPHDQLLQRLRSLLSHDEKNITLKITDKREKFGLKTKTVVIEGYPTVIFCTARFSMADQEKTRLLLLSPEISQEKLKESIRLRIEKESDRQAFQNRIENDPLRRLLAQRIEDIKNAKIKYINVPDELKEQINQQFIEDHKFLIPRHQRDISRLEAIIKGYALLNFNHRKRVEDSIIVTLEDVEVGFRLYYAVSEANELGLSPEIYNILKKLKPCIEEKEDLGISISEFQIAYSKEFHKRLGYNEARNILKTLCSVGLLTEINDPSDKRLRRYIILQLGVNSETSYPQVPNNIVSESDVQKTLGDST